MLICERQTCRFEALQFGHGGDAVENLVTEVIARPTQALQFGHGGDAVENNAAGGPKGAPEDAFNSATAVMPWKIWTPRPIVRAPALQFGHGGDAVENPDP